MSISPFDYLFKLALDSFRASKFQMLIAQCNGYRILKQRYSFVRNHAMVHLGRRCQQEGYLAIHFC